MATGFKIATLALISYLIVSPAMAAEKDKFSIIASIGRSTALNACESPWVYAADAGFECGETGKISRIAINYKFSPMLGIEISGGDLGLSSGNGTYLGDPYTWQMKSDGWTVAGIGFLPIGSSFSLFAKAGFIRSHHKEDVRRILSTGVEEYGYAYNGVDTTDMEKNSFTYGVGFQYNFFQNLGLRVQYENFGQYDIYSAYDVSTPERIRLTAISAGLAINF